MANQPTQSKRWLIKTDDPLYGHYVAQQLAYWFVLATQKLNITPNQVSVVSLLFALAAVYFFAQGTYNQLVIGVVMLNISLVLDCADGMIARLKGLKSQLGAWVDYHFDKIKDGLTLGALAFGAYVESGETIPWIFGVAFLGIFFHFLRKITAMHRDIVVLEKSGKRDELKSPIAKKEGASQFIKALRYSLLFQLADRVMLFTIFGLLNLAKEAVIVYTVLAFVYAVISAAINYRTYIRYDKTHSL